MQERGRRRRKKKKIGAYFNFPTCLIITLGLIIRLLIFTSGLGCVFGGAFYMEDDPDCWRAQPQQPTAINRIVSFFFFFSPTPFFSSLRRTSPLLITPIRAPCDAQGLVGSARTKGLLHSGTGGDRAGRRANNKPAPLSETFR